MSNQFFDQIFKNFGFGVNTEIKPFGSGLINNTWLISDGADDYILQRINHNVFKQPANIATNIRLISEYLTKHQPGYLFITPLRTITGEDMMVINGAGYFRVFPFVKNSHTIDAVTSPSQAYEAAKQFGRFANLLKDFPVDQLTITIPDFHNLPLRFDQFKTANKNGNYDRIKSAAELINFLVQQEEIVEISKQIGNDTNFKKRVTHHDTKISNVLFDENEKGLCVIDLDTVMPGYFISDLGDMMRTYLSPVSEEEKDLSKIEIRDEYYKAIVEGYLSELGDELSKKEKENLVYAGKFMIYMQALRFLTDHLNNDIYYGAKYEGHNLLRATNQVTLLKLLMQKESELQMMI